MRNYFGLGGFFVALLVISPLIVQAQDQDVDVIYLKNGKIISGKIVERIPDKTVVIETKDGIEFVDYVDIKRIQKEFIPKIDGISPLSGVSGSTVTLTGTFPASKPKDASAFFGTIPVEILQWSKTRIDIRVPDVLADEYVVTLQLGNQKAVARIAYTVTLQQALERVQRRTQQQVIPDEEYNLGGFWMNIGYTLPLGDFGKTDGPNSGYAKNGFGLGYEGRIHLSQNFYLPLNFHVTYLSFNIEELQKKVPVTITSEGKSHGIIWFTVGLGFAIHLSSSTFLFASSDVGPTMVHLPDVNFGTTTYASANTFTSGFGFSGGITFSNAVSFGYRFFTAKPKHKIEVSLANSVVTQEIESEQKTEIGQIYISIAW